MRIVTYCTQAGCAENLMPAGNCGDGATQYIAEMFMYIVKIFSIYTVHFGEEILGPTSGKRACVGGTVDSMIVSNVTGETRTARGQLGKRAHAEAALSTKAALLAARRDCQPCRRNRRCKTKEPVDGLLLWNVAKRSTAGLRRWHHCYICFRFVA